MKRSSGPRHGQGSRSLWLSSLMCALVAAWSLAGCGGADEDDTGYTQRCGLPPATPGTLVLPEPTGDHCIGKTQFRITDASRLELYTDDRADHRELHLKTWYPVPPRAGRARSRYMEEAILPLVKQQLLIPDAALAVTTHAFDDAPMRSGARYPVVIFSPGFAGVVEGYTAILEEMASHGVVVIAIDHPYVSGATSLSSGEIATVQLPADSDGAQEVIRQAAQTMVEDQRHVLDWLHGLQSGRLHGHLDYSRIGAYGHSLGGSSALQSARQDVRVKAAIDIDGSVQGETDVPWSKPLLFLLAENQVNDPTVQVVVSRAGGMATSFVLAGSGHFDFSDLKLLLQFYVPDRSAPAWKKVDLGTIDGASAIRWTREQVLRFFGRHVMQ